MRSDTAGGWTHPHLRGLQAECPMRPLVGVVLHELGEHRPQMLLVQQAVIWTFVVKGGFLSVRMCGAGVSPNGGEFPGDGNAHLRV